MNPALRNAIARPSLRGFIDNLNPIIDAGAATSTRPVQPGHCLDFDGVNQYLDSLLNVGGGTVVDIRFTINPDSVTTGLLGCGATLTADKGFFLETSSGAVNIVYSDGTTKANQTFNGITLSTGTWYECRLFWGGGATVPTLTVNGVDYFTTSSIIGWSGASADNLTFAAYDGGSSGFYDGKLGFCKYGIAFQYNNDYSSGSTAIDSLLTFAANDGTLVNGPTWTTDSGLPFSHLNQNGYTDVAGLLTPRDESDPTKDTDGNTLEFSGSAFPRRPVYRGSYGIQGDLTNDYATTGIVPVSSGSMEVTIRKSSVSAARFLFGSRDSTNTRCYIGYDASRILSGGIGSQSGSTIIGTTAMVVGEIYTLMMSWTGSTVTLKVNGVTEYSAAQAGVVGTVEDFYIGTFNNLGSPFGASRGNDEIFEIKVNGVTRYTCADGVGTTIHDVLGTHDATVINAGTATEGVVFWAGRIDGEDSAHNINNGFTLYENGGNRLRVPYVGGSPHPSPTIPGGYTLTSENPAVTNGYNDAETTLDLYKIATGDTIAPETNHLANFEDIVFADTNYILGTTSPVDTVFIYNKSAVENSRLLGYEGTQDGTALVYANNFTHGARWNDLAPWDDDEFWTE